MYNIYNIYKIHNAYIYIYIYIQNICTYIRFFFNKSENEVFRSAHGILHNKKLANIQNLFRQSSIQKQTSFMYLKTASKVTYGFGYIG